MPQFIVNEFDQFFSGIRVALLDIIDQDPALICAVLLDAPPSRTATDYL